MKLMLTVLIRIKVIGAVVMTACLAAHSMCAVADPAADIKYRQSVMKVSGGHMGALVALAKGQVNHQEDLALHAQGLAGVASMLPHLFPVGSEKGKTKAKAAIWTSPDDFNTKVKDFQVATEGLSKAVKAGTSADIGVAMGRVGKACKGCHDKYQEKE